MVALIGWVVAFVLWALGCSLTAVIVESQLEGGEKLKWESASRLEKFLAVALWPLMILGAIK